MNIKIRWKHDGYIIYGFSPVLPWQPYKFRRWQYLKSSYAGGGQTIRRLSPDVFVTDISASIFDKEVISVKNINLWQKIVKIYIFAQNVHGRNFRGGNIHARNVRAPEKSKTPKVRKSMLQLYI